jgi:phage gpG-like protein
MFTFHWEIWGDTVVREQLSRFTDQMDDFTPVFQEVALALETNWMPSRFAGKGGDLGKPWPPLSPRYAAWKALHYPGRPMMVLSGRLKASLTGRSSDSIRRVGQKEFEFGTAVPYGVFHHFGTSKMPQRRVVALTDDDQVGIGKMIHRYCIAAMGRLQTGSVYSPPGFGLAT